MSFAIGFSRFISVFVILGSWIVKVPIMLNIYKNKTGEGVSESSLFIEGFGATCFSLYFITDGVEFLAWGENIGIALQVGILLGMIWYYDQGDYRKESVKIGAGLVVLFILWSIFEGVLLPITGTSLWIFSQGPQIYMNFQNGHTGSLSILTQTANVIGVLVRIFTSTQLVGQTIILIGFLIAFGMQSTLLGQIVYYRKATEARMSHEPLGTGDNNNDDNMDYNVLDEQLIDQI